jgi:hypothetical protein
MIKRYIAYSRNDRRNPRRCQGKAQEPLRALTLRTFSLAMAFKFHQCRPNAFYFECLAD